MKPGTFSLNRKYKLSENLLSIILGGMAIVVGSALLLAPLLRSDFPMNDGGLFYVMVKDLVANNYRLPHFTSYNDSGIPFVYPPLPIYPTGFFYAIVDVALIRLLRWLPLIFTILSIPAFGLLSQTILKSKIQSALAMLAFALLLPPFNRLTMGEGLTRALGLLFSLLALTWIYRLYTEHSRCHVLLSAIFSVLVVLSHGVYAWFVIFSAVVMFAFSKPKRQDVMNSFLVVLFAVIFEGANLAVSASLFARRLSVPTCLSPSLLIAFVGGYCYNLRGSTRVLQGFPARCSVYFPNSTVGCSA